MVLVSVECRCSSRSSSKKRKGGFALQSFVAVFWLCVDCGVTERCSSITVILSCHPGVRVLVVRILYPREYGGLSGRDGPARCTVSGGRHGTYDVGEEEEEEKEEKADSLLLEIGANHAMHVLLHRRTGRSFVVAFMDPLVSRALEILVHIQRCHIGRLPVTDERSSCGNMENIAEHI